MASKKLEFVEYISICVGMALASSGYAMISEIFHYVSGNWIIWSVFIAALLVMTISFSVSETASMYPAAPGIRTYLKEAFGDRVSLFLHYYYWRWW